jgi:undecaprenyl diphosphate synthase
LSDILNKAMNIPTHIAFIMDGNGRWATNQGLKRVEGHKKGAEVVRYITTHCVRLGVEFITMYAFSTENWNRPKIEVDFLMRLLEKYLKDELETYQKNNIKFKAIGDISKFNKKLQKTIETTQEKTKDNSGLTQILALNYGSQDEILRAIIRLNERNLEVTKENFESCLDTYDVPAVDLMIRTSGEIRISNFLLWQCAYAELFFTDTLWPDFAENELDKIIEDFNNRTRKFGGL